MQAAKLLFWGALRFCCWHRMSCEQGVMWRHGVHHCHSECVKMSVIKNFCIINVTLFLFSYKKPKCVCTINQVLQLITVFVGARVQWTTQPCFFYSTVFGIFFTVSPSQQLKQKITIQKERVEFATLHEGIQPSRNCVIIGVFVCFLFFGF